MRLASDLTGWTLNVMTADEASSKQEGETKDVKTRFMESLDVGEDVADALIQEGFTSLEDIAYVPTAELLRIEGFDEGVAAELQRRASDVLLTEEIASQAEKVPAEDLLSIEGMTQELANVLAQHDIKTREDLAEQSVDDVCDVVDVNRELIADLIMKAREHWFA